MIVNAGRYGDHDAWKKAFVLRDEIVVPSRSAAIATDAADAGN
jgi:hypothetical protein